MRAICPLIRLRGEGDPPADQAGVPSMAPSFASPPIVIPSTPGQSGAESVSRTPATDSSSISVVLPSALGSSGGRVLHQDSPDWQPW